MICYTGVRAFTHEAFDIALSCSEDLAVAAMAGKLDELFSLAVKLSDNMPDKPRTLDACGDLFMNRFRHTEEKSDIDKAILAYESAIQHLQLKHQAVDDVELIGFIHDAGTAFLERYNLLGNLSDIDQAISSFETVTNTTSDYVDMPDARNDLGISFRRRFEKTGNSRIFPKQYHLSRNRFTSLLRTMQICLVC
jgi:hypothetical protein